jgi:hypothetical protein
MDHVGFGDVRASYVALGTDLLLGDGHPRILHSHGRYGLAAAVGVAVEQRRDCTTVSNGSVLVLFAWWCELPFR